MDEQERLRLKKTYEELPEEKLIEVILEDEEVYKKEPYEEYELLLAEAKRRGIEKKIEERKKFSQNEECLRHKDMNLVVIRRFPYRNEAEYAKNILESNGIEAVIVADDCGFFRPHLTFTGRGVELSVKKEDVQKAQEALRVLGDSEEENK